MQKFCESLQNKQNSNRPPVDIPPTATQAISQKVSPKAKCHSLVFERKINFLKTNFFQLSRGS